MKRKHVIATFALSALMGIGVFAGVRANKVKEANAATGDYGVVGNIGGVENWNPSNPIYQMTDNGDSSFTYSNLTLAVGDEFKTVKKDATEWQGWWSFNNGPSNSGIKARFESSNGKDDGNVKVKTAGTYNLTYYNGSYSDSSKQWKFLVEESVAPTTKYNVDVYVDGVKRGTEEIAEGNLPDDPAYSFGQSFSGWYDDAACSEGHKVTGVTSNAPLYGKILTTEKVTFALDITRVATTFTGTLNLYAWDAKDNKNADWPGKAITDATAIEVPEDARVIINNGTVQTVDITTLKNNDTLRILNDKDEMDHYKVQWQSDVDEPAEDGYYLVGTESSWKYAGATKMVAPGTQNDDLAQIIGYEAKANEEFKVRSYLDGTDTWYQWGQAEEGHENDNYAVGAEAKTLDIYLNNEGKFYVFDHVEPDPDVPAEEGYYIVGTESEWKYEGATKMDAGDDGDLAKLINYQAKANEEFKIRGYHDGVSTWYQWGQAEEGHENDNYLVGETAKALDIFLNAYGKFYVFDHEDPDIPTEGNGYYIVGSETEWKFTGATKMAVPELEENDAELLNYTGKVGEKLKVRYYNGDTGEDIYGFCKSGELAGIGEVDEKENFVFTAAAAVDIFAKWEEVSENNWQINFYVTAHADRYVVTIHDVLFEGAAKVGVAEQTHTQRATAGVDFEYNLPDMNGYVARALYTDANCTTLYEKHALTGNTDLYAKYTRLGYYMTGDSTYTGSKDTAWQIDGSSYLTSNVNDPLNRLEGTVVIPASADEENPVVVKALQFTGIDEEGKTIWAATTYELGATYTFVELDKDSNFVFKKGGTFAVYINQENKVYFNEGAAAFYTKFITDMNHVCDADGHTNLEALGAAWAELKVAYDSLSADEKAAIVAVGIEHGDPSGDDLHKVVASYEYIVKKYGTNVCEDFIWNGSYVPNANYGTIGMAADDSVMTIVVIASISVISAAGLFFLIRRKRRLVK